MPYETHRDVPLEVRERERLICELHHWRLDAKPNLLTECIRGACLICSIGTKLDGFHGLLKEFEDLKYIHYLQY